MSKRLFTPESPPKSGKAKKIWDWWIKHKSKPPDELYLNHPGYWQRKYGVPNYYLKFEHTPYLIWDVERTISLSPDDALWSQTERCYYLE